MASRCRCARNNQRCGLNRSHLEPIREPAGPDRPRRGDDAGPAWRPSAGRFDRTALRTIGYPKLNSSELSSRSQHARDVLRTDGEPVNSSKTRLREWLSGLKLISWFPGQRFVEGRGSILRVKLNGGIGTPWLRLAIQIKDTRQQFDFVSEQFEGHDARQIGQVLVFHMAERDRLFGGVKADRAMGGISDGTGEFEVQVGHAERWLLDGQSGMFTRLGAKGHLPRSTAGPEMLVGEETSRVKDRRQQEGGGKVPQHADFVRGRIQSGSTLAPLRTGFWFARRRDRRTMDKGSVKDELKPGGPSRVLHAMPTAVRCIPRLTVTDWLVIALVAGKARQVMIGPRGSRLAAGMTMPTPSDLPLRPCARVDSLRGWTLLFTRIWRRCPSRRAGFVPAANLYRLRSCPNDLTGPVLGSQSQGTGYR
jgi:hypothetical protein